MSPNAVRCMWNGFPIAPFTPPTPLRYRQIRWPGSFAAWSSRMNRGLLGNLVAGKPEAVRAFGDEDVEYLAPLLVEGLARAAADQQVGFRVVQSGAPISSQSAGLTFCVSSVRFPGVCASEITHESTGGSLYAYGQSLYLTLTDFRHRTERAESDNPANRPMSNSTGLANHTVHFVPESAKRPDSYRNARSTDATLVIDYDLLATMPALHRTCDRLPLNHRSPAKGEPTQRDTDLDEIRKELQDIKKKLAEQEAERTRSTPRPLRSRHRDRFLSRMLKISR